MSDELGWCYRMGRITKENIEKKYAIVLDGQVYSYQK